MNLYASPVRLVPRECKPGVPLAETKRLVIDYQELTSKFLRQRQPKLNQKGSLALIEMTKIDNIWSRLKGAKHFTIVDIRSGYHHILIH